MGQNSQVAGLNSIPRAQRKRILNALRAGERSSTWNKYYSRVRFSFVKTGAGPFTYQVLGGTEVRAFAYPIGGDMAAAGLAGTSATNADTNLIKPGETISGEKVIVYGISAYLCENSDSQLAKTLFPLTSINFAMNGDQDTFKLGLLSFIPAAAGLTGMGDSAVVVPPLPDGYVSRSGNMTNGAPFIENFYPLPEPLIWNPAGNRDSTLNVRLRVERAATYVTQTADRAGAAGVAAWTSPATLIAGVELVIHLHSRQLSKRSENQ